MSGEKKQGKDGCMTIEFIVNILSYFLEGCGLHFAVLFEGPNNLTHCSTSTGRNSSSGPYLTLLLQSPCDIGPRRNVCIVQCGWLGFMKLSYTTTSYATSA